VRAYAAALRGSVRQRTLEVGNPAPNDVRLHRDELTHHPRVFVFEDMAVEHQWGRRSMGRGLHGDSHGLHRLDDEGVAQATLVRWRQHPIAREQRHPDAMYMNRMRHARGVGEFPDFNGVGRNGKIDATHVECRPLIVN